MHKGTNQDVVIQIQPLLNSGETGSNPSVIADLDQTVNYNANSATSDIYSPYTTLYNMITGSTTFSSSVIDSCSLIGNFLGCSWACCYDCLL